MSGGLAALLDDIAALVKLTAASIDDVGLAASRASAKAAGVVIDDTAVTPRYVHGFTPDRELPIVMRIARGSLVNKAILIVAILVLSYYLPWVLTPLLMLGGLYLSYEGAEKVWERLNPHHAAAAEPVTLRGGDEERTMVTGAIRTDFILSAEIMVLSSTEVRHEPLLTQGLVLLIVAVVITALVYGVVAVIVKMDDVGLALARRESAGFQRIGRGLVKGMPAMLAVLSTVGIVAMLWVGGHILLTGFGELATMVGQPWLGAPYGWVHHLEGLAAAATGPVGPFVGWLVNTFFSFLFGLAFGAVMVALLHLVPARRKPAAHSPAEAPTDDATPPAGEPEDPAPAG